MRQNISKIFVLTSQHLHFHLQALQCTRQHSDLHAGVLAELLDLTIIIVLVQMGNMRLPILAILVSMHHTLPAMVDCKHALWICDQPRRH